MPPPAAAPARTGSGPSFLALLLGGIVAGGIGYAIAEFTDLGGNGGIGSALTERLDSQDQRIDAQAAQSAETEGAFGDLQQRVDRIGSDLDALRDQVAAMEGQGGGDAAQDQAARIELNAGDVADLRAEVERLSQQVGSGPSETVQDLQSRVEELAAQISEQDGAIAAARDAAVAEARSAAAVGAIAEIRAAVEAGTPFPDALGTLRDAGVDVPAPLPDVAPDGVATLAELQDRFPDAARAALDAALSETVGDGALDRIGAFLASQTGARSLGEREGSGADAILSRAEARMREGDLAAALSEIEALPQSAKDAMSDWIDAAETRLAAQSAATSLAQPTNSN